MPQHARARHARPRHARPRPARLRQTGRVLLAAGTVGGGLAATVPASAATATATATGPGLYAHTSPDTWIAGRVSDTAILSGLSHPQPGAVITFSLYGPNDTTCDGLPLIVDTQLVPTDSDTVSSDEFLPLLPGTYRWIARYSGDDNNPRLSGSCNDPGQTVKVTLLPGTPWLCRGLDATLLGSDGADLLIGTPGDDVIVARGGNDTISGRGGNDTICAGEGDDNADGGSGNDTVLGNYGNDALRGGTGHDTIRGGRHDDTIGGGPGHDTILGERGDDVLRGWTGNDDLDGGTGLDTLRGGDGRDHCHGGEGRDNVLTCERID